MDGALLPRSSHPTATGRGRSDHPNPSPSPNPNANPNPDPDPNLNPDPDQAPLAAALTAQFIGARLGTPPR